MSMVNQHISEDDLALFALALMPPQEAAYTLAHLKHCDACRGEVARMQGDLVGYAFSADVQEPAAETRSRLLDAVAKEKRLHIPMPAAEPLLAPRNTNLLDREQRDTRPANRGMGIFGWTGWALAAGLAAFAGWQFQHGQLLREEMAEQGATTEQVATDAARAQRVLQALTDPAAMQVALHLPSTGAAAPKPEAHASYNSNKGELVLIATHMQAVEPGKTYELWVLPAAAGEAPVAAGLFRPDVNGNASVVLPELPRHVAAKGFGVTIEDSGGSKSPTPPIVLAGT